MPPVQALHPDRLARRCDPSLFDFETTDELTADVDLVGQPRVLAAVRFGVDIDDQDYNIFAVGPTGTGKHSFVTRYLEAHAAERAVPDDLCYVNNFSESNQPVALMLPAGSGVDLRSSMTWLIEEVTTALPAAFESEEYQARLQAAEEGVEKRSAGRIEEIQERSRERGIAMVQTPMGMMFTPLKDGEPLPPEAVKTLDEHEQQRLQDDVAELQKDLQKALAEMPRLERERRSRVRELDREVSDAAIRPLVDELRDAYREHPAVLDHLEAVRHDLVENARNLLKAQEQQMADPLKAAVLQAQGVDESPFWRRYRVNVLVDRSEARGAPVVYEDHPTYQNLLGRIEHLTQMGALTTDFSLIRSGALHRANGGYLIIDALQVLQQPFAWDGLKPVLKARRLKTESPGQAYTLISTVSLEPQPVPMNVKVVLKVGQVNGLSVLQVGTFAFGMPTRITCRVRMGKGIDIEREVELGGPLHAKGVLILSSFLGARYATDHPLSLSASLVFEQSYRGVEGDSASSAELYALLSAIAEAPVNQALATTGSVDQHGEIQPIGGVNEKIEGFFDLCRARGLSGDQGVLIPASNVKHLTLRADVIAAVEDGVFNVYPIETVDQGGNA